MRVWTPTFDMTSIPEDVFKSEDRRRKSMMRKTFSGGVVWGEHNPDTPRCRCAACTSKRVEERIAAAAQPKRPRGRPAKVFAELDPERIRVDRSGKIGIGTPVKKARRKTA